MKKIALWMFLAAAAAAWAGDPFAFAFQGVLKNADGSAVKTRNVMVKFRLYAGLEETECLWGRQIPVQLDTNGLFNVVLGDGSGSMIAGSGAPRHDTLAEVFAATPGVTYHIGMEVAESSGELRPRTRLSSVPLAAFAQSARKAVGDFAVGGKMTATGVTADSLAVSGTMAAKTVKVLADVSAKTANVAGRTVMTTGGFTAGGDVEVARKTTVFGTLGGGAVSADSIAVARGLTANAVQLTGSLTVNGANGAMPVGGITLWSGDAASVPSGWALCDGGNGTPDLRGRFIVGAGKTYSRGATGGQERVTVDQSTMPAHSHGLDVVRSGYKGIHNEKSECVGYNWSVNRHDHGTSAEGGGASHENRPPYYALCYIMKIK